MKYPKERKEAVIKKMLPPHHRSIASLAEEEGIAEATLYNWRNEARRQGRLLPDGELGPQGWTSRDKFAAVVETAAMNEAEIATYCRERGLYPEQLQAWRAACEQANDWERESQRQLKAAQTDLEKERRALERELRRKEKALAEAAALLVLEKKAAAIWGTDEDA